MLMVEKSFAFATLIVDAIDVTLSPGTFQLLFLTILCFGVKKPVKWGVGRLGVRKPLNGWGKEKLDEGFDSSGRKRFHFASVSSHRDL
jgi:hypothetical protein